VDLRQINGQHKAELIAAFEKVLDTGEFILGETVAAFEADFASAIGTNHAVGVASGTDALQLALWAVGISSGDEVITAANTFYATVAAIELAGARPILVDCDPQTHLLDPELLEAAITDKTKAIVPVHLYGQPAAMDRIMMIAEGHGLEVVEDACQAHGATLWGRPAGSWGRAAAFSFYPSKNLGGLGDGGCVTTNDEIVCEKLLLLRNYGSRTKNEHIVFGTNSRLDAIQAAALRVKLKYLAKWNACRSEVANQYRQALERAPGLRLPAAAAGRMHVYHIFVVEIEEERNRVFRELGARGIQCGIHYPYPIHLQPAFRHLGYRKGAFPAAERASQRVLSLPLFPGMTEQQVGYVCECLTEVLTR
jgi:dTDP-4-amino-4,6-dideoxygalactose transaminase